MRNTLVPLVGLSLLLSGCGAHQIAQYAASPDSPVPPTEARAELRASVDLHATQDCEERFDLRLYQDRAIDLIQWDERRGECVGRKVAIRYLTARTSAERVERAARSLCQRFTPEPQGAKP